MRLLRRLSHWLEHDAPGWLRPPHRYIRRNARFFGFAAGSLLLVLFVVFILSMPLWMSARLFHRMQGVCYDNATAMPDFLTCQSDANTYSFVVSYGLFIGLLFGFASLGSLLFWRSKRRTVATSTDLTAVDLAKPAGLVLGVLAVLCIAIALAFGAGVLNGSFHSF